MEKTNPPSQIGHIVVLSGPSGVGKGTLCGKLMDGCAEGVQPRLNLTTSVTSRPRREGEVDGVDYFFVTREGFEEMVRRGGFLEWAEYNNNFYGTPRSQVEDRVARGENVLLEIDTQGALMVKELFPEALLVFVAPPSLEELEARLRGRGTNTEEDIQSRLAITRQELELRDRFDRVVVNGNLEACFREIQQLIREFLNDKVTGTPVE